MIDIEERKKKLELRLAKLRLLELRRSKFIPYVKHVWPDFIAGRHHEIIAEKFEAVADGKLRRLIITMPPRHTKSEFASYLLPSWMMGKNPKMKIIQATHTAELAVGFGRKVKNLIETDEYAEIFPETKLAADSKAAGRWNTSMGGDYHALGVGGAMAGKGADLCIIDDPHSEADALSQTALQYAYEWFTSGPRQRLQPGGRIVIVMCVEENQRVLMADGTWRPIKTLAAGDEVVSLASDQPGGKAVHQTVTNVVNQGPDDLLEVVSRSCSVKVNARHPFLVVKGGAKLSPRTQEDVKNAQNWHLEWVRAGELEPGDTVVTVKSAPGAERRPAAFNTSRQMNQKDYWLFGFLFGDGWVVNSRDRGAVGVCCALGAYEDVNEKVALLLAEQMGCKNVRRVDEAGYLRAENAPLARWLTRKGLVGGAKGKRLPDWVFQLRACDKRAFLRGFLEADGCRHKTKQKNVETYSSLLANRELLDDLRLLARTCGVRVSKIYEREAVAQPPNSPEPFLAKSYMARFSFKHNRVELRARYREQCANNFSQHFRFEDVEAVNPAGKGVVYDISVTGEENFIAEGFVVHNTRWGDNDLVANLLESQAKKSGTDQWEIINFPAIMPSGKPCWPEMWPLAELEATKASIPLAKWNAQYQQDPTSDEVSIIKREWWQKWDKKDKHGEFEVPPLEAIIQAYDTAYSSKETSDFSAISTWGIFYPTEDGGPNIILLDCKRGRWDFPELKRIAKEEVEFWQPEDIIIEAKASGTSLAQELRRAGIPVVTFSPSRGNDRMSRVNAVAPLFESGVVWAPGDTSGFAPFAEELIEEAAAFPRGRNDDMLDTAVLAMMRYRKGNYVRIDTDEEEEYRERRVVAYY